MNMIKGIEHIAIFSHNTAALKDWYMAMFDFVQVYDNGKGTYFLKSPDGAMLEFVTADEGTAPDLQAKAAGIRHLAIGVTTDGFDNMVQKLRDAKVEVVTEPTDAKGVKTFFFRDIDGNVLHLIARVTPLG